MNGCSTKESVREFARTALREDLAKAAHLPNCLYNFHPGSHLKQGAEVAIPMIADMLNYAMDQEELPPFVLLETMAGKGTEVGRTFEELAAIIDKVERKDRMACALIPATSMTAATTLQEIPTAFSPISMKSSGFPA